MLSLTDIDVNEGVVEGGLFWVIDNGVDLLVFSFDSFHESLFVIFRCDFIKRNCIVRCIVRDKKGILMLLSLYLIFIHTKIVLFFYANIVKIILILTILKAYLTQMKFNGKKVMLAHSFCRNADVVSVSVCWIVVGRQIFKDSLFFELVFPKR